MKRAAPVRRASRAASVVWRLVMGFVAVVLVAGLGWSAWVYTQIEHYAHVDEAAPADAICVLGAAEYSGRPSPVLRARLEHALQLYHHGIAPMILTLGGSEPGDAYSEGQVGELFLMANGVPERSIIAETESRNTEEQAQRIVEIARTNGFRTAVVVSDPTHMFRIHEICRAEGLHVWTSPRPQTVRGDRWTEWQQVGHEIVSYTLWRMRLA